MKSTPCQVGEGGTGPGVDNEPQRSVEPTCGRGLVTGTVSGDPHGTVVCNIWTWGTGGAKLPVSPADGLVGFGWGTFRAEMSVSPESVPMYVKLVCLGRGWKG